MTGKDVKRQVMEAIWPLHVVKEARAALAPCVVLTPEEAEKVLAARDVLKASLDLVGDGDWTAQDWRAANLVRTLDEALLTPEAGDE